MKVTVTNHSFDTENIISVYHNRTELDIILTFGSKLEIFPDIRRYREVIGDKGQDAYRETAEKDLARIHRWLLDRWKGSQNNNLDTVDFAYNEIYHAKS